MTDNQTRLERFGAPAVLDLLSAPRRRDRFLVVKTVGGSAQLHAWDRATGVIRALTDAPSGVAFGWLAGDAQAVYRLDDPDGSERGLLLATPFDGRPARVVDPALPRLGVVSAVAGPTLLAFTVVDDDGSRHFVVEVAHVGEPGCARLLARHDDFETVAALSADEDLLFVQRSIAGRTEVHARSLADGEPIGALRSPVGRVAAWTASTIPGDSRILADSEAEHGRRALLWEPRTGAVEEVPGVAGIGGETRAIDWDAARGLVLVGQVDQPVMTLFVADLGAGTIDPVPIVGSAFGAMPWNFAAALGDGDVVYRALGGERPGRIERTTVGGVSTPVLDAGPAPLGRTKRSVTFPSTEGATIQGWLTLPEGAGPHPAIVDIHGGPHAVAIDEYRPDVDAFADAGFAVLSVNYRGSTGFGREHRDAIYGRPGILESDDAAAGAAYLVDAGIARPDSILVAGMSWGGFVSLMTAGRHPGRWAGVIARTAVGDAVAAYEEEGELLRSGDRELYGGTPAEVPETYARCSPLTYASAVRVPILVINGRNDTRCPPRQIERYAEAVRGAGGRIEIRWFEAGHLAEAASPEALAEQTRWMLDFAVSVVDRPGGHRST